MTETVGGVRRAATRWRRLGLGIALAYFVILGGTPFGDASARLLLINTAIGAAFVWRYLRRVSAENDLVDRLALAAYLVFLPTIALSGFPRQSLDIALSTLAALAVFHFARRELLDPVSRGGLFHVLTVVGLLVGVVALLAWGARWVIWLQELGTSPPRESEFSGLLFGHRHDVALLLGLCAPAAFALRGRWRPLIAVAMVVVVGLAFLLEGSRNALLAAIVASGVAAIPFVIRRIRARRLSGRGALVVGALAAVIAMGLFASGLIDRLASLPTLFARVELWSASVEVWTQDLLTGHGPGSFPWLLQLTDYFATASFAPRHPDNALAQLVAEAGLMGVAAAGIVIGAVVVGIRKSGRWDPHAVWALTFFGAACLFANPTDFGFLLAVGLMWAAVATPPVEGPMTAEVTAPRTFTALSSLVGALVLLAAVVMAGAAFVHEEAAASASRGDVREATAGFELAITLDPAMALYERELGIWLLEGGDPDLASVHLARAIALNQSDTVALRGLAETAMATDRTATAVEAAEGAVDRMRSDPANLLTLARALASGGTEAEEASAMDALAEAVATDPRLLGMTLADYGLRTTNEQALASAVEFWTEGRAIPGPVILQPAWLSGLAGRDDLATAAVSVAINARGSSEDGEVARITMLTLSCQIAEAQEALEAGVVDLGELADYWELRYMTESAVGTPSPATVKIGRDISVVIRSAEAGLSRPNDLVAIPRDAWGYGRSPRISGPIRQVPPSLADLATRWASDPIGTARAAMPDMALAGCEESP